MKIGRVLRMSLCGVALLLAWPIRADDAIATPAAFIPSDKGGFRYSEPPAWPTLDLDLSGITQQVAEQAATRCGSALAATPLQLGDSKSFMENVVGSLAQKAAGAAIGKLLGGVLGGGGSKKKPTLYKDPIKKKFKEKFENATRDTRLQIGGQMAADGLLLSAYVDKARGKGTFHTVFLERPDCVRIWPDKYLQYRLWGSWSISVSVTRTTRHYRDGELVSENVSRSGWSDSGDFDFSKGIPFGFSIFDDPEFSNSLKMVLNADAAYLNQLRREIGQPAWAQMGFGEPMEGVRGAGAVFRVPPELLTPETLAVVHITHVQKGQYSTVGFPFTFQTGDDGMLTFTQMPFE